MTEWSGQRVLLTGATGFIGTHLTWKLAAEEAQVWAGVLPAEAQERVAGLPPQIERIPLELQDAASVREAVCHARPDLVFHLAAVGVADPKTDPALALAVNAGGTIHLLEALRNQPVRRIVLLGTCYEYGAREAREGLDPFNAYAASKVAAWACGRVYWRAYGLPTLTVRPFQVYGPGQPARALIPSAIRAALDGAGFPMTPGAQERDFVYVKDVVEGVLAASSAPGIEGQSLDIGTGSGCAIRQAVELVWRMAGGRGQIRAGALAYRPGEAMSLVADADHTATLTGWRARTGLEDGLRQTIDEFSRSYTR